MRCSFLSRTHQPVLHYSGSQERTNQFQQPLIADPFGDLREQSVVVDPVEKFLEIQIHHPAVAFGLILLRLRHRLMCRSLGPKPIAVFRERSVPAPLQRLHHRLLYEPIQHRWDGQRELHLITASIWDGRRSVTRSTRSSVNVSKCSRSDALVALTL